MKSVEFAYWLQGFFEISEAQGTKLESLNAAQVEMIKKHLALVFKHDIDPSYGDEKHQQELSDIHDKKSSIDDVRPRKSDRSSHSFCPSHTPIRC